MAQSIAWLERYLEEYAETHKRSSSVKADRRNLENHIVPLLGRFPVADVTRADIDASGRRGAAADLGHDRAPHDVRR